MDIIVEMPPDLFQTVQMKEDLEQMLAAPVDLIRYHKHSTIISKAASSMKRSSSDPQLVHYILTNITIAIARIERRTILFGR